MFFNLGVMIREASIPYIIAEIGVNHEGSFEKAIELIDLAKEGEHMQQNFRLIST